MSLQTSKTLFLFIKKGFQAIALGSFQSPLYSQPSHQRGTPRSGGTVATRCLLTNYKKDVYQYNRKEKADVWIN